MEITLANVIVEIMGNALDQINALANLVITEIVVIIMIVKN